MRVFRYRSERDARSPRVAVAAPGGVPVDLVDAWTDATGKDADPEREPWLTSTLSLIEAAPRIWREVAEIASGSQVSALDDQTTWLCPLDRIASLKDFLAFEDHVKRGAERRGTDVPAYWYEAPVYYKGNHRALLGPDEGCARPSYTQELDFELELGMVVGRAGRDVKRRDAGNYVFGFTAFNDFSARDIQAKEMSAWLGPAKGKDFANAFGPCIVTADEVGSEPDLEMICRVNGEEWGRARSSDAHWRWADMIAHVSMDEDIHPGDVFGSGTPGGCCGLDLGRHLEPGDVVELEIENIGTLRNRIAPT